MRIGQRDANPRQAVAEPSGVKLVGVAQALGAVDARQVVVVPALPGQVLGHGQDVRPLAEQVDLDEVDVAGEDLPLLGQVRLPARPGGLVRRADNLDHRHDPLPRAEVEDGDVRLMHRLGRGHDDDWLVGLQDGDRAPLPRRPRRPAAPDRNAGCDPPVRPLVVHPLLDRGDVPGAKPGLEAVADVDDQ
jgi:hypothetical protein